VRHAIEFARNGQIRIAYSVLSDGPTDFLYLSVFSNLDLILENPLYAEFLESIAAYTRLIVADRRGQGVSDRLSPRDIPLLEDNVDDMIAVLDAAGSRRAILMGGSDIGGLCTMLAASYPERVAGLVLFAPAARQVQAPDYPWTWTDAEWKEWLDDVKENWGSRGWAERNLPLFCPSLVGDPQQLDWWERFLRGTASANVQLAIENAVSQMDVRPLLPTIHAPTLIMHRVDDRAEYVGGSRYLARAIPHAQLVELAGADHFPWSGDQEPVLREIARFVKSTSSVDWVADRVLATVMFTDIVDSTAHAASLGDRRWRETREAHDRIVRDQVSRFRGREVKTMGDGFLVTFDGPARGVLCAREICAFTRELGIDIRVGLHTGEIELDGDDVSGIAVAIGARVGALAGPGEVFVSSTVKDLVVGSGIVFEDRGQHPLKGVPEEWRLYAAVGERHRGVRASA
jgi:pimeloyl-ACP methyl ester carboxylesterase